MKKLMFVSLGCDKNLSDSEHMLSLLAKEGFVLVDDEVEAEVIVVNTCCFIHDAMEESITTLLSLGELKKTGNLEVLLAAGCLAQRYAKDIRREIPEVDGIIGTNGYMDVVEAVQEALAGKRPEHLPSLEGLPSSDSGRLLTGGGHYAYLKIAEGCDKRCTYCVIPDIRGPYRSVPIEDLVQEARELAEQGVKELILVAQETTLYGVDIYGKKDLPRLLEALNAIEGIVWIRLLYCYPEEIDADLITAIKTNQKVCHYLDIPIQHCNDTILRRMGRRTTKSDLVEKLALLRREIPDIALRTTLLLGFPGETEEMHEELMDFVRDMQFDRLGAFCYSREEGTKAAEMPDQVARSVAKTWYDDIMRLQADVSGENHKALLDRTVDVFVEGRVADEPNIWLGRTYRDAPDIDGYLFWESEREWESGRFVKAVITGAHEYDLTGELIDEPSE